MRLGVVVIGRNEGERLRVCLRSVLACPRVVYVDSGSTDGSVAVAEELGVAVHRLDMSRPFTAARARNAGFEQLLATDADIGVVQFVDGDCEVVAGWLRTALAFLVARPDVAVVCGRRRERFPERSIYNRLCDIEWNTPVGETRACGGDAAIRASALRETGGFRADLIAGEEPELCLRLRAKDWKIWRLDAEMTRHDAAILTFRQWWQRTSRAGYAYAQGAHLHGRPPERHWVRESRSAWVWGAVVPALIVGLSLLSSPMALFGLVVYPIQFLRLYAKANPKSPARGASALFLVIGKFSEARGQMMFWSRQLRGGDFRLIEYK